MAEVDRIMSQSRGEAGCGASEYKVRGRDVDYEGLRGEREESEGEGGSAGREKQKIREAESRRP